MEEKNAEEILFLRKYLTNTIQLETQKKIAEETFYELVTQEKQWKKKMEYVAQKRSPQVYMVDVGKNILKGIGISFLILWIFALITSRFTSTILNICVIIVWIGLSVYLAVIRPIRLKMEDAQAIERQFSADQETEKTIKEKGEKAIYIVQQNRNQLKKAYNVAENNLNKVYAANIIYKKYQTLEACSSILEYLESGRCYALEGPYGAYNKYDDQLAKGKIIGSLDAINLKMDKVIENQQKLYSVAKKIENDVTVLKSDIATICNSLQNMEDNLDSIAKTTQITAWSTSVIATKVPDWHAEAQKKANTLYM